MYSVAAILLLGCVATSQASYGHGGGSPLAGVPNEADFGSLVYPQYNIIDLGSGIKGSLPPAVVQITRQVIVKEPQPYPVKIPVPVPHPVPVAKPYPVVETKIVQVPHPVPYEVIKKVPVPVEVPKPFPVPSEEFKAPQFNAPVTSYENSFGGHGQLGPQELAGGYESGYGGGYEGGDQGGSYAESQVQPQTSGWVGVGNAEQQGEGQH